MISQNPMGALVCVLVLLALAIGLPCLANLCLIGLYTGCPTCRQLVWRGAQKCAHCHAWVR